ncbi:MULTISPECIES: hypothetical protein [Bacillus cereus group]|uniref:Uncharacterized protein n=1 Tax=Bacillus thuringiensis TaxID=1428 RepID=A0A9X7FX36_BACTU|nr:hypothetical protein [Bacillus thuringiensis]MCQ6336223.1 hypothetical protein [Bacillus cereus]PFT49060.1 hypothetical protein COK72_06740 [Bacillus thuringiensis]
MNKIVKRILIAVAVVVVFIIGAFIGAIGVYNDEEFKDRIREEEKTELIDEISEVFEALGYDKSVVFKDAAPSQVSI